MWCGVQCGFQEPWGVSIGRGCVAAERSCGGVVGFLFVVLFGVFHGGLADGLGVGCLSVYGL